MFPLPPELRDEFPYIQWDPVGDGRTHGHHNAMQFLGIQGTAIYRYDDPVMRPRIRRESQGKPVCRCGMCNLSLSDAVAAGIQEAIDWEQTGKRPKEKAWVTLPFNPWARSNKCERMDSDGDCDFPQLEIREGNIHFQCLKCGHGHKTHVRNMGKDGRCSRCKTPMKVPI